MNRFTFKMFGRTLPVAAAVVVGAVFAGGAAAQDVAKVPIVVNVDASVSAVPEAASGLETVNKSVTANVTDTLLLPLKKTDGVIYFGGKRHADVPTVAANRNGNVTVNLPARSYKSAEVALYTVNGKRVMSGRVSSSNAVNSISRRNVSTGVYLLSVRGADGDAVTARLAHNGGGLTVSAAFGGADIADARKTAKKAADAAVVWTVTVSSDDADSVFTIQPVAENNALLNITLRAGSSGGGAFTDGRDGTEYKTVKIGSQTWMAKNLSYAAEGGKCYGEGEIKYTVNGTTFTEEPKYSPAEIQANCDKYGRLYDYATAKDIDKKYNDEEYSGSDVKHQGICPAGWHIPNDNEWGALIHTVNSDCSSAAGGCTGAGTKLKAKDGWDDYNGEPGNGTDDHGFAALPAGTGRPNDGYPSGSFKFYNVGLTTEWWSASNGGTSGGNRLLINPAYGYDKTVGGNYSKKILASVRCVKD